MAKVELTLGIVAIVVSGVGLLFAWRAARASERSAKAAEESARAARENLELAGQANVTLRDLRWVPLGAGSAVRFPLHNSGPGVARQLRFAATPDRLVRPVERPGPPSLGAGEQWLKAVRGEEGHADQIEFPDVPHEEPSEKDERGRPHGPGFCVRWVDISGERALFSPPFPHRASTYELPAGHPTIPALLRAYLELWAEADMAVPPYQEIEERALGVEKG